MSRTVHVYPMNDLIEHDTSTDQADCICGPTVECVPNDNAPDGWLISHQSLDRREDRE